MTFRELAGGPPTGRSPLPSTGQAGSCGFQHLANLAEQTAGRKGMASRPFTASPGAARTSQVVTSAPQRGSGRHQAVNPVEGGQEIR